MKREDGKNKIPGITEEQLNWLMQENGSDITREKNAAAALLLALTNQVLSATGHRVLPIESAELEQLVSTGLTIATALVSWWKNNSFTPEAIEADDFLCQLKEHR